MRGSGATALLEEVARTSLGVDGALLAQPWTDLQASLGQAVTGRRWLIVGAAGFIARQTLLQVIDLRPAHVTLADVSENGLAELVRDLRSSDLVPPGTVLDPVLVDATSPMMATLIETHGPFDCVLNFAAVKHVRTERDALSLLRMLQVNVVASHDICSTVRATNPHARQFVVSTDKAADPASFMGASKRLMEMAIASADPQVTSARFANVAFSSGSLPESWLSRLAARQPLAVPADTWRFMVTPCEAGQLCALGLTAPPGHIVVPHLTQDRLFELTGMLDKLMAGRGLMPVRVDSVAAGLDLLSGDQPDNERGYPVLVTPRDTPGEKQVEKFLAEGESVRAWQSPLELLPLPAAGHELLDALAEVRGWLQHPGAVTLDAIGSWMSAVVAGFSHQSGASGLDDRA